MFNRPTNYRITFIMIDRQGKKKKKSNLGIVKLDKFDPINQLIPLSEGGR